MRAITERDARPRPAPAPSRVCPGAMNPEIADAGHMDNSAPGLPMRRRRWPVTRPVAAASSWPLRPHDLAEGRT
jgi:hypothetical protein